MYYDVIIIGAGISGLYTAYKIKNKYPEINFIILESNSKEYIGGRTRTELFYEHDIAPGAGILKKDTDKLTIKLLKQLQIKFSESPSIIEYSNQFGEFLDVLKVIKILKKEYKKYSDKNATFQKFGKEILGKELYNKFIESNIYDDFEHISAEEVLYEYEFDKPGSINIYLNWGEVIHKLIKFIDIKNIRTSTEIIKIKKLNDKFAVISKKGTKFFCNNIVMATTIESVQKLLHLPIYNEIHGSPCIRIYGKFDSNSSKIMAKYVKHFTIMPSVLHNIIPISPSNGIYMIAYSDEEQAKYLRKYIDNTEDNCNILSELLKKSLGIKEDLKLIGIKGYYWKTSVHFYEPRNKKIYKTRDHFIYKAQHPKEGVYVVGECVSNRQGWVEGAISSVEKIF